MKKLLLVLGIGCSFFTPCKAQSFPYIDFDSLSIGMTSQGGRVLALTLPDSDSKATLFAGGHFTIAGRNPSMNIAQWQYANYNQFPLPPPGGWEPLGSGVNNDVCALTLFDSNLYAGGKFDTAGGIAASRIARWDTARKKWDSLAGQLNGNVYALCVYHNMLYVGGDFTIAGGDTVNRIAVWNNHTWNAVGKGFDTGAVYALAVSNDTLYAGGSFIKSGGTVLNHIAKLSGPSWKALGVGTNNTVYALTDWGGALFVGGAFTKSGGIPTPYLSYFDNSYSYIWNATYYTVNDTVRALCGGYFPMVSINKSLSNNFQPNLLLVGGSFDSANGVPDKYFTMEPYGVYSDTCSQLSGPVYALAAQPFAINYAGGEFKSAKNEYFYKYFTEPLNNVTIVSFLNIPGGVENLSNEEIIKVYPNPSNGVFQLEIKNYKLGINNNVEVYNMLGEKVYTQLLIPNSQFLINMSNQPNGIYFCRVLSGDGSLVGEGKLVIEK